MSRCRIWKRSHNDNHVKLFFWIYSKMLICIRFLKWKKTNKMNHMNIYSLHCWSHKTNSKATHLSIRCSPANGQLTKNIRKEGATFAKWNKFSDNMKVSRKKNKTKISIRLICCHRVCGAINFCCSMISSLSHLGSFFGFVFYLFSVYLCKFSHNINTAILFVCLFYFNKVPRKKKYTKWRGIKRVWDNIRRRGK